MNGLILRRVKVVVVWIVIFNITLLGVPIAPLGYAEDVSFRVRSPMKQSQKLDYCICEELTHLSGAAWHCLQAVPYFGLNGIQREGNIIGGVR